MTHSDPGYGIAPPGFRLPDETRLGGVRLQVADLARSLAYYERVLGSACSSAPARRARSAARRHGADRRAARAPGARPVPRRGRLGLYHFAILLPDRAALGAFVRHLGEIGERAGMSDHLVSEAIYLTDPDGLGIEVYADRPRGTWRHEGRQLAMATEPLDIDDLARGRRREPWSGMPAGTVLGHVHLYVGDLDRGRARSTTRARLRQDGLELSGRAVHVRRRLPSPPRHQHVGAPAPAGRARTTRGCSSGSSWCRARRTRRVPWRALPRRAPRSSPMGSGGVARDPGGRRFGIRGADESHRLTRPRQRESHNRSRA